MAETLTAEELAELAGYAAGNTLLSSTEDKTLTTTKSTSPAVVTVTKDPTSTTTTTQNIYDDKVISGANEEKNTYMGDRGFVRGTDGRWINTNSTIGDLLGMKLNAAEAERMNRLKATNAGVYNALSSIGDMITAGIGGNVYKREKDNTAENAAKDTIARRDAITAAELNAKEKDRIALNDALAKAKEAHDKYMELHGAKRSEQNSDEATETREVATNVTTTTQKIKGAKRDEVKYGTITIKKHDGSYAALSIDEEVIKSHNAKVIADLNNQLKTNKEWRNYAIKNGWLNTNESEIKSASESAVLGDSERYKYMSPKMQRESASLYKQSKQYEDAMKEAGKDKKKQLEVGRGWANTYLGETFVPSKEAATPTVNPVDNSWVNSLIQGTPPPFGLPTGGL